MIALRAGSIPPAPRLPASRASEAQRTALELTAELGVTGLLAVELFAGPGELLVNELAMRPHNCGHWTIDGATTSIVGSGGEALQIETTALTILAWLRDPASHAASRSLPRYPARCRQPSYAASLVRMLLMVV